MASARACRNSLVFSASSPATTLLGRTDNFKPVTWAKIKSHHAVLLFTYYCYNAQRYNISQTTEMQKNLVGPVRISCHSFDSVQSTMGILHVCIVVPTSKNRLLWTHHEWTDIKTKKPSFCCRTAHTHHTVVLLAFRLLANIQLPSSFSVWLFERLGSNRYLLVISTAFWRKAIFSSLD